MTSYLLEYSRNTLNSLALFVKHCKLQVYRQYINIFVEFLIQQPVIFGLHVLTQYFKFDKVIRNNRNKFGNQALKSDLKSVNCQISQYILVHLEIR